MSKRTTYTGVRYGVIPVEGIANKEGEEEPGRILWFADDTGCEHHFPMFDSEAENIAKMLTEKPSDIEVASEMPPVPPPGQAKR